MIVDFDDFHESQHRLDLLHALHDANPAFRCTLFAVPALGSDTFWRSTPSWCEIAVHGFQHGDPPTDGGECRDWPADRMRALMESTVVRTFFAQGFKAPGWKLSDGCYQALLDGGWWCADQHLEDARRPRGLKTYLHEDHADAFHGHIGNVCGNGIEERFDDLLARVRVAESFQFASEAVVTWA